MSGNRIAKALLTLLFVGLLAALAAFQYLFVQSDGAPVDMEVAEARYGLYLEEVSADLGIDFYHHAPQLDPQLEHIMPKVSSLGASVSVVDVNRNGWPDLYVTNSRTGSQNALYLNQGDGTFEDAAEELGIADVNQAGTGVSMGAIWGDVNNNGYEDLFLYKWGRVEVFLNNEGQGFTRVTEEGDFPKWANVNTAVWLDYDGDGNLDLFFSGYYADEVNLWDLHTTRVMPESFEYALNGGRNYLFRGNGDGTFEDVSHLLDELEGGRWTMAVSAADLTRNGYPDLFLANDYAIDEVYINEEGEGFRSVGRDTGIGFSPKSGMNVAFGDILNRGEQAIYVTNISEQGVLIQGNNLWMPDGVRNGIPRFQNMAGAMGVELGGWSYGAQFGDLNNSGSLDLILTNGYVSGEDRSSYWYDFSKITGAHRSIISDAKNWPALRGRSLSGHQSKRLWLNDGTGRFQEVSQAIGFRETYDGRSIVLADLGNRGVLDAVVAHQRGPLLVYRNAVDPEGRWIGFELEGSRSNRSAIGAEVEVHWNSKRQLQTLTGGSGFSGQNQRWLHFGLGATETVERVLIRWPSGQEQTIDTPEVGRIHQVKEPV